jgi:tetrahydrofolate dehydrogenase/cyclohydrolase, NAD(P)-binding domain protein|nr:MAG TPA: hypothetical protein [Caudoviricetes sp.]
MKKLIVIYDKEEKDKGRDSYIKAIKKAIPQAEIYDKYEPDNKEECEKVLILKPMKEDYYKALTIALEKMPWLDVEGAASGKLTITAEAIIRAIGPVDKKTVVILNQSDVLGRPLAKELIDLGANVISLNSSYPCIDNLLTMTDIDVLVSASGKYEFKLDRILTRMIDVKVDLSDDLEDPIKITTVPTVEVLKERLEA